MGRRTVLVAGACLGSLLLLGTGGPAAASEVAVGTVIAVRGAVFADSGAGLQPLTANARIRRGDAIVSKDGKAKIALNDGTIVSVGENSRVRIADSENAPNDVRTRVSLVAGVLRLLVAIVPPAGRFEVESETAIAAVRGTDWLIEATPERTSVAVVSGTVVVSGRGEHARTAVVLDAHRQGTDVRRGAAPTAPAEWGDARFSDTLARAAFE